MKTSNLIEALCIIQKYDKNTEVYSGDNKVLVIGMDMVDKIDAVDLRKLDDLGFINSENEFSNSLVAYFM